MPDGLFDSLPIVGIAAELEKIKQKHPSLDPYYVASGCIAERRNRFERLWLAFAPYADTHFLKELKLKFHQRTWEMYIGNVLLGKNLTIASSNEGPDFIVVNPSGDILLYVECVAPTKGMSADAVPDIFSTPFGQRPVVQRVPEDNIILRITAAVKDKADQYKNWASKGWFDPSIPYVIALNTGDLEYPGNPEAPYTLKALFSIGHPYMTASVGSSDIEHGWTSRSTIERSAGSLVPVDSFLGPSIEHVSGLLFSDISVVNHPEKICSDCFFVNNPFTTNPLGNWFREFFTGRVATKNSDGSVALSKKEDV